MEKIYDIKGYWNDDFEEKYSGSKSWSGQIKVDDDGWFEGVVVDSDNIYSKQRFICGIYHDEKVIELYKLTPSFISDPFVFHCEYGQGGYDGDVDLVMLFGNMPFGVSRICTREVKGSPVEVRNAIEFLDDMITENKESIFDETCRTFYQNAIEQRKSLSKIVLKNYLKENYTQDEIKEILDETEPIKERVIKQTMDATFSSENIEPGILCINDTIKNSRYSGVTYNYRGHVKIDENGWFEGYIKQVGYTYLTFVFGIYIPGKELKLYTCFGKEPEIFSGRFDKNNFIGTMNYMGRNESELIHKISFSKGKISEEGLNDRIEESKTKMKDACIDVYDATYKYRKEISDLLFKEYMGIPYSEEDKKVAREITNKKREIKHKIRKMNTKGRNDI